MLNEAIRSLSSIHVSRLQVCSVIASHICSNRNCLVWLHTLLREIPYTASCDSVHCLVWFRTLPRVITYIASCDSVHITIIRPRSIRVRWVPIDFIFKRKLSGKKRAWDKRLRNTNARSQLWNILHALVYWVDHTSTRIGISCKQVLYRYVTAS